MKKRESFQKLSLIPTKLAIAGPIKLIRPGPSEPAIMPVTTNIINVGMPNLNEDFPGKNTQDQED
jgi:hypothetical protein